MKIELNKKYLSGLKAHTDLHAGGLFFCIIYQNCLEFFESGEVAFTKKLIDAFKPMDAHDVSAIENYNMIGEYFFNDKGYLECKFEFLELTGLPTEKDQSIIPFHAYDSRWPNSWSEVYKIEQ